MRSPKFQPKLLAISDCEVQVGRSFEDFLALGAEWDQLLAHSSADTIFLTSAWLRAWLETYGQGSNLLIPQIRRNGKLIAAAAFRERHGIIEFAGLGPSDYLDLVVSADLDEETAQHAIETVLRSAQGAVSGFRYFLLNRVPLVNGTLARLNAGLSHYHATLLGSVLAPSMDMSAAPEKLQKKSLRRHERDLLRQGSVDTETFTRADEILPRLNEFFDQHIRRWQGTPYPSLFHDATARAFYEAVTRQLDASGWLQFTQIRLDGRLVAAHFGFFHGGRFIWYKPCYEPALSKSSPGEVLIKRLIEGAQAAGANEFDFTIGEEAFKMRFATKTRVVADIHVANSAIGAWRRRARLAITSRARAALGEQTWKKIKIWLGRR